MAYKAKRGDIAAVTIRHSSTAQPSAERAGIARSQSWTELVLGEVLTTSREGVVKTLRDERLTRMKVIPSLDLPVIGGSRDRLYPFSAAEVVQAVGWCAYADQETCAKAIMAFVKCADPRDASACQDDAA